MSPQLRCVLVAPRIAGNVGNVARTCLALGAELHLIRPFGFILDPVKLKRSSVGYWDDLKPEIYSDAGDFWGRFPYDSQTQFYWATKNGENLYFDESFQEDVVLIFGNEEEGVPQNFWDVQSLPHIVACRIPTASVRCLNLGVSVAIMGFEVLRQWSKRGSFIRDVSVQ